MTDKEAIQYLDDWLAYFLKQEFSLDLQIRAAVEPIELPTPILEHHFLETSVFIWKKPELSIELVETYPYGPDGSSPSIMLQIAWFEIMFESPLLYKYIYKRKHGFYPEGLS